MEDFWIISAIELAEQKIACPYVWGGVGEEGFDCSGLWYAIFSQLGINFSSRFTASMFSFASKKIIKSQIRRGDFIFRDQKPGSKKHRPIYHIEMIVCKPFIRYGKIYVKTLGSSTDKGILNDQGEKTKKSGVGYRIRELTEYRHFGRPPFYHQLAAYEKTHNKEVLLASTGKVSSEMEQALVA